MNRSGTENGAEFWGGSRVLGPDGEEMTQLGTGVGRGEAVLDLAELRRLRRRWPLLREARPDLIGQAVQELIDQEE